MNVAVPFVAAVAERPPTTLVRATPLLPFVSQLQVGWRLSEVRRQEQKRSAQRWQRSLDCSNRHAR